MGNSIIEAQQDINWYGMYPRLCTISDSYNYFSKPETILLTHFGNFIINKQGNWQEINIEKHDRYRI